MMTRMSNRSTTCGCNRSGARKSTMGQRLAVAIIALGLGSVIFGLIGFKKHQHDSDEIAQLSREYSRAQLLSPETVHPSERMARWNLLVWTGVSFSYIGVTIGVISSLRASKARSRKQQADAEAAIAAAAA